VSISDAILVDIDGVRTLYVGPAISESLPPLVREGLARRRLVSLGQECPCGARMPMPNRETRRAAQRRGEPLVVDIAHADDCPAVDPQLDRWVA
jgi:hypothetical protein